MAFVAEGSITVLIMVWYTLLQRLVPGDLLGRVISLDWMISIAGVPALVRDRRSAGGGVRRRRHPDRRGGRWARPSRSRSCSCPARATRSATARIEATRAPVHDPRRALDSAYMEYTHVGRLGLVVSRLCLGTMNFGPHASEDDSHRSWMPPSPTASTSSTPPTSTGATSASARPRRSSARWVAKGGGRRDKVVLATKVYGTMGDWPNEGRLSKLAIVQGSARSRCGACGTDRIDLYQMHHIDRNAWWDEIWEAMEQLKRSGKILYVGSSNFAGWHIARGNEIAARPPLAGPGHRAVALQPHRAHARARGDPRGAGVRHGPDPVQPARRAACSPAR